MSPISTTALFAGGRRGGKSESMRNQINRALSAETPTTTVSNEPIKIFAISDTHGFTDKIKVPQCDILIHAGDICVDGYKGLWCQKDPGRSMLWFKEVFVPWLQPYLDDGWVKHVVLTWGNHDWVTRYESNQFMKEHPEFHILLDSMTEIEGVKIWGSPWSNQFMNWAWMKEPADLKAAYDMIPEGIDIIVSHQPPMGAGSHYYDITTHTESDIGSIELMDTIHRVKPKAVICGHIHSGFGIYDVGDTKVYNVSFVNEQYRAVNEPVEIIL